MSERDTNLERASSLISQIIDYAGYEWRNLDRLIADVRKIANTPGTGFADIYSFMRDNSASRQEQTSSFSLSNPVKAPLPEITEDEALGRFNSLAKEAFIRCATRNTRRLSEIEIEDYLSSLETIGGISRNIANACAGIISISSNYDPDYNKKWLDINDDVHRKIYNTELLPRLKLYYLVFANHWLRDFEPVDYVIEKAGDAVYSYKVIQGIEDRRSRDPEYIKSVIDEELPKAIREVRELSRNNKPRAL